MLTEALTQEITIAGTTWAQGLAQVKAMSVDSPEDYARAGELTRLANANYAALETKRTGITKPLLEAKRNVDELFRAPLIALAGIVQELKGKLAAYDARTKAERARVMAESAEAHAAGLVPTELVPAPAAASGVSVREMLDFEIIDAPLVPRRYCTPDERIIREVIREAGDIVQIPGVRVFRKSVVAVRK